MHGLCQYVQMQAWLSITPENSSTTNRERYGEGLLPDIDEHYCYLPDYLHQIGTAGRGFDSLVPLTFHEIEAWARMTRADLTPFEVTAIRAMSAAYAAIASDRKARCPVETPEVQSSIDAANAATWMAAST